MTSNANTDANQETVKEIPKPISISCAVSLQRVCYVRVDERTMLEDTMEEDLLVPSTRLHDLVNAWNGADDKDYYYDFDEVELRAGAPAYSSAAGEVLHPNCTWEKMFAVTRSNHVWMGPEVMVGAFFFPTKTQTGSNVSATKFCSDY
jgi:hypothetical protein